MCAASIQVDVVIPTQTKYLDLIGSIGERIAKEINGYTGDKDALAYQLNLVLTEATANAIKHGGNNNDLEHTVRISIHLNDKALIIQVFDYGQGFDLDTVPTPDFGHPQESGMGLFFIRSLMDSVTYTRQPGHNVLEIVKHLK